MNTYSMRFANTCPVNGVRIEYLWSVESRWMIPVEDIVAEVTEIERGSGQFHEAIADRLAARFLGNHTITATHHGVQIKSCRSTTTDSR